jgi:hypothetical protein
MPEEKISLSEGSETDYTVLWKRKDLLRISLNPYIASMSLKLNGETIVAHIEVHLPPNLGYQDEGNNFVLCATDDNDYGTWRVLEITNSPFIPKPVYPIGADMQTLERVIKMGNTVDIYQKQIKNNVEEEIASLLNKAFEYYNRGKLKQEEILETFTVDDDVGFGI